MDAIGRLLCDGVAVGTAFGVDEDGLAVTAAHVIGHRGGADWTFEPLTAPTLSLPVDVDQPRDDAADVALLHVADADDWQPLPLASHVGTAPGGAVHLRGFAESRDFDSGVGTVVGETGERGRTWVKVTCQHAQRGMSGAPVLLTGTGAVIGVVSARLNEDRWNRDTVLLAPSADVVALAPDRLRLLTPPHRDLGGTLRLSWDRGTATDLVLETDDFAVSLGRNATNRVQLGDSRDSRFHGALGLVGPSLVYHHAGAHPAYLVGATRQVTIHSGDACLVQDKDRLRFASGLMLVEFSAPDLHDPLAANTIDNEAVDDGL